jgi:hypothetical protein
MYSPTGAVVPLTCSRQPGNQELDVLSIEHRHLMLQAPVKQAGGGQQAECLAFVHRAALRKICARAISSCLPSLDACLHT